MTMENEGEGTDPAGQFDAFRARRADERAQQESQAAYVFPPEYAAEPDAFLGQTQTQPVAPPYERPGGRLRSMLIFAGAVLVASVLGVGAWLALGSSGPAADAASTGVSAAPATPAVTTVTAKRGLTFRVTITSVGADSFSGTVLANGDPVTIALTADTRFGTKARPLSRSDLRVGETVIVRGQRTGTDTVTATAVA